MHKQQGFSLLELFVCLAVLSILLSYAAPILQQSFSLIALKHKARYLKLLIHKTRQEAVIRRTRVRLCPLSNQNRCTQNWQATLTMFVDNNNNKRLDNNEQILKKLDAADGQIRRTYPRDSIYFRADGLAWGNNGSLGYCHNAQPYHYIKIIISATGRIRSNRIISGALAKQECDKI